MNRWDIDAVKPLLLAELPNGMVDLWDAVPPGHAMATEVVKSIGELNQRSILAGLGLVQQKALAAAGASIGFRPEVFERIKDLPGFDAAAEILSLAWDRDFDLGRLTAATKELAIEILDQANVAMQATSAVTDALGALAAIVQVVWGSIELVVDNVRAERAALAASKAAKLDCTPLAFGAAADRALTSTALRVLEDPIWEDLFLPAVRPFDAAGNFLGFTCCETTTDRGRMIAPVGLGVGNRWESSVGSVWQPGMNDVPPETYGFDHRPGFGCLPMCPNLLVHRAIIVPATGWPYDPARALPQLGGLGTYVWRMLWARGPSAFAVDGEKIANAWREYFMLMRPYIGFNELSPKPNKGDRACDSWPANRRQAALAWLYERIGVPTSKADPNGIYTFEDSLPVSAWRTYTDYQGSLLGYYPGSTRKGPPRLLAAYVDSRSCHPAWRSRVEQAQRELLEMGDAVCRMDRSSIPDPDYRAEVQARYLQKKGPCWSMSLEVSAAFKSREVTATEGPSLDPLGEDSPTIPTMPRFPAFERASRAPSQPARRSGSKSTLVLGATALGGLGLLLMLRR